MPRRICSTVRNPPHTLMFASPSPVDPAAPTSLSQYCPAPIIGESPTRPGIFHERPLVVVTEERSPWGVTASQLIVPVFVTTRWSESGTSRQLSVEPRLSRHRSHASRG